MSGLLVFILRALLAATLYVFLGWALLMLWREVKQQATLLAMKKAPSILLTVTQPDHEPRMQHFNTAEIVIGRHSTCECHVNDDFVSAYHARLHFHHGQWWLEDLKSKNGTMLNGEKVTLPTVIVSGDEIRCGETSLMVTIGSDTPATTTSASDAHEND
jgi:pSer/pThr/pTyr-binding forkhead associated (FHA) protein